MTAIASALLPHKTASQDRAVERAREFHAQLEAELAQAGWDLDVVAPRMPSYGPLFKGKIAYKAAKARHDLFVHLFARDVEASKAVYDANFKAWQADNSVKRIFGGEGAVSILKLDAARRDRFLADIREQAAQSFDAYVAKLEGKVGEHVAAEYTGNLWSMSTIVVTKAGGDVERWNTQQILNVSVLGKLFNQWPTRRVA